jgi:simple sugar transport system ATP-binding protein
VKKETAKPGEPVLEVEDLHARDQRGLEAVKGVSLTVRGGEVVAIAGVDGNGQLELVQSIAGVIVPESGHVRVGGREVAGRGVRATTEAGLAHIPEDRHLCGLVLDFTLAENLALREYRTPPISNHGILSVGQMNQRARALLREYDVRGGGPGTLAGALSGGNQQKVAVAREVASNPELLIAHQPTRGLDVGAIEFVHGRLLQEREQGRGILLVSLEFEEIRALADRILVIYEGEIVSEFPPDVSEEDLGIAMTGGRGGRAAA